MQLKPQNDKSDLIHYLFLSLTSRPPCPNETQAMQALYAEELSDFKKTPSVPMRY
ncbi:MAG: hypothetical protein R2822_29310 [Spirosomataceae bacterium]